MSKKLRPRLVKHILTVSDKKKVDPLLVYCVMQHESNFIVKAESEVGASGLLQVMPDHFTRPAKKDKNGLYEKGAYWSTVFKEYRVKTKDYYNRYDPYLNVTYGIGILASSLSRYNGNLPIALSDYNAGASNVLKFYKKYGYYGVPNIKETKEYVKLITRQYKKLKGA